jgi:hypothetical protein
MNDQNVEQQMKLLLEVLSFACDAAVDPFNTTNTTLLVMILCGCSCVCMGVHKRRKQLPIGNSNNEMSVLIDFSICLKLCNPHLIPTFSRTTCSNDMKKKGVSFLIKVL